MKKVAAFVLVLAVSMVFILGGCGTKEVPDLKGNWKQVNGSDSAWQEATITDNTITINWVMNNGDTKSLYWIGTFMAPTTPDEPYTWESVKDTTSEQGAFIGSQDSTKKMTYEKNQISYMSSIMGTTTTVRLEKQK